MTDRHEAECARVEAEFNGTERDDPIVPQFTPEMSIGESLQEIKRLFFEMADRILVLEERLDALDK